MFGIFKELIVIGRVAKFFNEHVTKVCGDTYYSDLPKKTRNFMISDALKIVGRIHGVEMRTDEQVAEYVSDCIVVSYILLAKEISRQRNSIGHMAVTKGMGVYIEANQSTISREVLEQAALYLKDYF